MYFFMALAAQSLTMASSFLRFYEITHNDTPQSVGLLWTSDQPVAETCTWQHTTLTTNIHAPGGIRTQNLSRRAAADLRLRPRGHWDRLFNVLVVQNMYHTNYWINWEFSTQVLLNTLFVWRKYKPFLGAFEKLRKATTSFVVSVCLSIRMEKLGCHWIEFHEIWYLNIFRKSKHTSCVQQLHPYPPLPENRAFVR